MGVPEYQLSAEFSPKYQLSAKNSAKYQLSVNVRDYQLTQTNSCNLVPLKVTDLHKMVKKSTSTLYTIPKCHILHFSGINCKA